VVECDDPGHSYSISITPSTTARELCRNILTIRSFQGHVNVNVGDNSIVGAVIDDDLINRCIVSIHDLRKRPVSGNVIYLTADALLYPYCRTKQKGDAAAFQVHILGLASSSMHALQSRQEIASLATKITALTTTLTRLCNGNSSADTSGLTSLPEGQPLALTKLDSSGLQLHLNGHLTDSFELSSAIQLRYSQFIHEINEMLIDKEASSLSTHEKQLCQEARSKCEPYVNFTSVMHT
jgi:hypothetical protein